MEESEGGHATFPCASLLPSIQAVNTPLMESCFYFPFSSRWLCTSSLRIMTRDWIRCPFFFKDNFSSQRRTRTRTRRRGRSRRAAAVIVCLPSIPFDAPLLLTGDSPLLLIDARDWPLPRNSFKGVKARYKKKL